MRSHRSEYSAPASRCVRSLQAESYAAQGASIALARLCGLCLLQPGRLVKRYVRAIICTASQLLTGGKGLGHCARVYGTACERQGQAVTATVAVAWPPDLLPPRT